ncbi:hypothetical protein ACU4GD_35425 [Cupriavidus basilensis]
MIGPEPFPAGGNLPRLRSRAGRRNRTPEPDWLLMDYADLVAAAAPAQRQLRL